MVPTLKKQNLIEETIHSYVCGERESITQMLSDLSNQKLAQYVSK